MSDDAQPKRYKPGATEMLKPCTVPKNTTVVLHGFKKAPSCNDNMSWPIHLHLPSIASVDFRRPSQTVQHNGREAKVRGFDQRTDHRVVEGRGRRESSGVSGTSQYSYSHSDCVYYLNLGCF